MKRPRIKRPSAALVVAMIALFVALGGTAGAVVTQVALAKRALVADNAKRLNGVTAAQLGGAAVQVAVRQSPAGPRPASTAASLVTIKTSNTSLGADGEGEFTVACDAGQTVAGGGFSSDGSIFSLDSYPVSANQWRLYLANLSSSSGANITLYATCVR